jgi:hypothetical protein
MTFDVIQTGSHPAKNFMNKPNWKRRGLSARPKVKGAAPRRRSMAIAGLVEAPLPTGLLSRLASLGAHLIRL